MKLKFIRLILLVTYIQLAGKELRLSSDRMLSIDEGGVV